MKPLYVSFIRQRSVLVALVGILACDSSDGDKIKRQEQETFSQTEFYTLSASSVVIDFKALIKKIICQCFPDDRAKSHKRYTVEDGGFCL